MDWVAGKKDWREFYRLKEGLGLGTAYYSAKANNTELAEELAKQPVPKNAGPPEVDAEGFDPLMYRLAAIEDRLIVLAAQQSGDGKQPAFTPRPVFAVEKIRKRESKKRIRKMISQLVPDQPQP